MGMASTCDEDSFLSHRFAVAPFQYMRGCRVASQQIRLLFLQVLLYVWASGFRVSGAVRLHHQGVGLTLNILGCDSWPQLPKVGTSCTLQLARL